MATLPSTEPFPLEEAGYLMQRLHTARLAYPSTVTRPKGDT